MERKNYPPTTEQSDTDLQRSLVEGAQKVSDQAGNAVRQATDTVKQVANDVRTKDAATLANDAKQATADAGAAAAEKVDEAMSAAGQQMEGFANSVRENAPSGKAGEVATSAADALERSGQYLQDADIDRVRTDLERVIREHPIETLLVGVGVGYMLARATRR